jgi:hypothetical protein
MPTKPITLATTRFLDSSHAASLDGIPREEQQRVAEAFLEVCYEELGKEPRFLDAEDVRAIVAERLPGRFARRDPAAEQVPAVLEALVRHLAETTVMSQAFEVRQALPAASDAFLARVRSAAHAPEAPAKADPFVHGASKLGRNDPCSCGSGKKYKKCHGKDA